MKVFCFHRQLPTHNPEFALVEHWRKTWERHGWEPVVLGEKDLNGDSETVRMIVGSKELNRGPCPPGYNVATHLRWVALAAVGGGLMVDYDVMNVGFHPHHLPPPHGDRPLFLAGSNCPCVVNASTGGADSMIDAIEEHAANPDGEFAGELSFVVHDQAVFERFPERWDYLSPAAVKDYGDPGWQDFPLVHFANRCTLSPRIQTVRKIIG